jgi:hypothetical protein
VRRSEKVGETSQAFLFEEKVRESKGKQRKAKERKGKIATGNKRVPAN